MTAYTALNHHKLLRMIYNIKKDVCMLQATTMPF